MTEYESIRREGAWLCVATAAAILLATALLIPPTAGPLVFIFGALFGANVVLAIRLFWTP